MSKAGAFDWHSSKITPATPITPDYRNTQNVRRFFTARCGEHFKFDVAFMAWMKAGSGKTMGDAVAEWLRREKKKQKPSSGRGAASKAGTVDWHSSKITPRTPITPDYRNTRNVRRFFKARCGEHFKFDLSFMGWIKAGSGKTMGDAVQEWLRREKKKSTSS